MADKTFLDLWAYPNTYIDKKLRGQGDGKELCDLLVVFGNDVLIFSDKSIGWPEHADVNVSWIRWFKRAVEKSVDQIRGAERWLKDFPERVFLDKACTQKLPMQLPPLQSRTVHGIAVVQGAESASQSYFGGEDRSLAIFSSLKGEDHKSPKGREFSPFMIGDVDPAGPFVHVFDRPALDLLMRELDTVGDFVQYIKLRAEAIRGGKIFAANNEGELLAFYLQNEGKYGQHSFESKGESAAVSYFLPEGGYEALTLRPEYKAKIKANKISYNWDRLISLFTEHVLAGTSVTVVELVPEPALAERALRIMASESRTRRRALSIAFVDVLEITEIMEKDRYARVVVPDKETDPEGAIYVFLILAYPKDHVLDGGYEQYRRVRIGILETYCYAALYEHRHLKRVVGIAFDASEKITGRLGGSEDLMAVEVDEWTDELIEEVRQRRELHDVMVPKRMKRREFRTQEFPELHEDVARLTRQQRRAAERQERKESMKRALSKRRKSRRPKLTS
ncbi:MAG: hypothetical protein CVT81_14490 [Alphaproteobacteria bacterium HGW-Alphaproteobacteria-3]|nr:MAG: hypothetical protein CVT81_14490 [Alphaproteobacteria bacterium HGW-Alphaproteobacteria-3]